MGKSQTLFKPFTTPPHKDIEQYFTIFFQELNACDSNPCYYGGTCNQDAPDIYHCSCVAGTTGENCAVNIDDCVGVLCDVAGSACVDGMNEYTCRCMPGYMGKFAGVDIGVMGN